MSTVSLRTNGFTLIELMVSLGIFAVLSLITYSTFATITATVATVSEVNTLSDRGQRILAFMEDDMRMAGYLVGTEAQIPYCTDGAIPATPNAISHTPGNPYDSLTYITAIPVELSETPASCMTSQFEALSGDPTKNSTTRRRDYYLTTRGDSGPDTTRPKTVYVDAADNCYDDIAKGTLVTDNAKSLITFAAVAVGNASPTFYEYSDLQKDNGIYSITLKNELTQKIPDNSTVYSVRQLGYGVVSPAAATKELSARTLRRLSWKVDCSTDAFSIFEPSGTLGGVDGLKFEFTSFNTITNTMDVSATLPNPLKNLKGITVWLLLRSDRKSRGYTNTDSYTLGRSEGKLTLGPYNDPYHRVLVNKTVEVINFVSKT